MDVLYLLIGAGIGGLSVWFLLRARYGPIEREFSQRGEELKNERVKMEGAVAEIRTLADAKARAEQQVSRVPELEGELWELREALRTMEYPCAQVRSTTRLPTPGRRRVARMMNTLVPAWWG